MKCKQEITAGLMSLMMAALAPSVLGAERTIFDMDERPTVTDPPADQPTTPRRVLPQPAAGGNTPAPPRVPATPPVIGPGPVVPRKPVERVKLPPAAEITAMEKVVVEVYAADLKQSGTPLQKRTLARQLLRDGKSEPSAAGKYVLLKKARDLGAEAGDAELVEIVVADMMAAFEVEGWKLAAEVLLPLTKASPSAQAFTQLTATHAIHAMEAADFATAKTLAEAGAVAARGTRDLKLAKRAAELVQGIQEAEDASAHAKKEASTDAEANLAMGKYLCFYRGDWKNGLPKLAASSDQALAEAARKELAGLAGPEGRIALGDAWWDIAEKTQGFAKRRLQEHAAAAYKESLAGISGLTKTRVMKRLAEAGMEVLEVPDFVVAYLDSIADKLPRGDEPWAEFRQKMSAAGRGGQKALQIDGKNRTVKFLGRTQYIIHFSGTSGGKNERTVYRSLGVRFEYRGVLIEFAWRETRKTTADGWRAIYDEWSRESKAGKVFVLEGEVSGFQMFTTLPAPDGRQRITLAPVRAQITPAVFTVTERP